MSGLDKGPIIWDRVKNEKIQLPVKSGAPDLSAMELLISAIQKIVIKDVVFYTDKKISVAKDLTAK